MSLLSQWTEDKTNMTTLYNKTTQVHGGSDQEGTVSDADYLESLMDPSRKNQWRCTKMPWSGSRVSPTSAMLTNYLQRGIQYRSQDTNQNWGWDDYYIGIRECWIYSTQSYSTTITWWTDDEGALFVNGSRVATSDSCTNTSSTISIKKGLNHIMITFSEQSGGDGAYMTTNPFTMSYIKWGYACFKM